MNTKVSSRFTLSKQNKIDIKLFLAILPFMIITYLYCYRPMWGLGYAFIQYKAQKPITECEFRGLYYFRSFFINAVVKRNLVRALRNTIIMNVIGFLTSYLAMFVTIFMNEIKAPKYKRVVQILTTIPNFVSWIIIYSAFFQLLAPTSGLVSIGLNNLGIIDGPLTLLTSADLGYFLQWFLNNWKGLGWGTIVYFAALGTIDSELYEAAAIDGAGRFAKMWHVTLPGLLPTYVTLTIMSIGGFLNSSFEFAFVFGNSSNNETLSNLALYVYEMGLGKGEFSQATAVGIFTSVIGLILLFISNNLAKKVRGSAIF